MSIPSKVMNVWNWASIVHQNTQAVDSENFWIKVAPATLLIIIDQDETYGRYSWNLQLSIAVKKKWGQHAN